MRRCLSLLLLLAAGCDGAHSWFSPRASSVDEARSASPSATQEEPARDDRSAAAEAPSRPAAARRPAAPPGSLRATVLTFNDETVTTEDVLEPIRARLEDAAERLSDDEYNALLWRLIRNQLLSEVMERLIWREATRELGDAANESIDKAIDRAELDRINSEFAGRESRYEQYLAELGKTRQIVRDRLRRRIIVEQYLRNRLMPLVSVQKRDIVKYYDNHRAEFSRTKRVEMFLIDVPFTAFLESLRPPTEGEKAEARRKARERIEQCRARLRAGESFEEVARTGGAGLHREDGGAWGFISAPLRGRYQAPSEAVLAMSEGQISDIIETPSGYFIVRAGRVEAAETQPLESVQGEIVERLRLEQFNELRARFVQRELSRSAVGDVEPFVQAIVARAPESKRRAVKPVNAEDAAAQRRGPSGG